MSRSLLNLCELERVARVIECERKDARVDKVLQSAPFEVVLVLSGGAERPMGDRFALLLSCRPGTARASAAGRARRALPRPPGFAQYLRAHLSGARLRAVSLEGGDRQLRLSFETAQSRYALLLSLLGPRSNLYAIDSQGRVVASARPLAETRRDLSLGSPWRSPASGAPVRGEDRFAAVPDAELLDAIEAHYGAEEAQQGDEELARRARRAAKRRVAKLERKVRLLTQDISAGDDAPKWKRLGELLKLRLGDLKKGMREISVRDFESGEEVVVPLDARLAPRQNLERLFRSARRAEKRASRAMTEIEPARSALARARALVAELQHSTPEQLRALAATPELARLLARQPPPSASAATAAVKKMGKFKNLPARLIPRRYATESGLEIWVGRNDEGNDLLTTRLAAGSDLFFHLDGNPGSHVVLRTEKKSEPPQQAVLDAAELAVHFSKARRARTASVHIAAIRDVSKPRGAKPGLVFVHRGRSIHLRRSEERLTRLLEARIEE